MALSNLADITRTIISLLEWSLRVSGNWAAGQVPRVFPLPPDKMTNDGLSFYLYHIQENAQNRNLNRVAVGQGQTPVQAAPMPLTLFYQLSARHTAEPADLDDAYQEQLMMSIAMRALYDYPDITDNTSLAEPGNPLSPINLFQLNSLADGNNRFRITFQPISYSDAVHFWTAGQSPLRLSAYYEVSVIFLEPKLTPSRIGRVLLYGTFVFTQGAPRITGSQNTLVFQLPKPDPAAPDQPIQRLSLQPAQAPPARPLPAATPPESQIDLLGTGFVGDTIETLISQTGWDRPGVLDAIPTENRVTVTIRETVDLQGNPPATRDVLPGIYSAQVNAVRRFTLPNGQVREFRTSSNQFPFTVTPRIDIIVDFPSPAVLPVRTGNHWTVGVDAELRGYRFRDAAGADLAVELYVGVVRYEKVAGPVLNDGQFSLTGAGTLRIRLQRPLTNELLRLLISGAEAPPEWISVP